MTQLGALRSLGEKVRTIVGPVIIGSLVTAAMANLPAWVLVMGLVAIMAVDIFSRSMSRAVKVSKTKQCDPKEPAVKPLGKPLPPTPRKTGDDTNATKHCRPHALKRLTPSFSSTTVDEQIQEMLYRMKCKPKDFTAVRGLAKSIDEIISNELSIHGAVNAFAYANPFAESPVVKLEPEISIVITVDLVKYHAWLRQNVHTQNSCTVESSSKNIMRRVKKCLLGRHDFKTRRFIFAENARLILNAPVERGRFPRRACIQLLVNDPLPSRGAKLMEFCENYQPLAADLILLTQQWAQWRAICLLDKGDMNLYVWTNLVIFYFQVKGLLPPYEDTTREIRVMPEKFASMRTYLFRGFFNFYSKDFDFNTEVVSVLRGQRSRRTRPSHASVCIEDPFDAAHDPAESVIVQRINLFKKEFQRADRMCSSCTDLSNLFACPGDVHA